MSKREIVHLSNVSKTFDDFSLNNVDITINKNEVVGLIGENGSGKTTILNVIAGIIKVDSGNVSLMSSNIGYCFDDLATPKELTVQETEKVMSYLFNEWDSSKFFNYINHFKLPKNKQTKFFSKGMKMQLNVAISLSHKADILLLDEVTAGLDPLVRHDVLDIISEYINETSAGAIMTTHNLMDILDISTNVLIMSDGKISKINDIHDLSLLEIEDYMKDVKEGGK